MFALIPFIIVRKPIRCTLVATKVRSRLNRMVRCCRSGVMGQNTDCPVVDCWNRGGLKIESSAPRSSSRWNAIYAGGLVGYCEEPVYNSYNRGNISLIDAHIDEEGSSQGSVRLGWKGL